MSEQRPRVGLSVIIKNWKGQILLGKRKGSHGAGTWALPGGHLEFNEDFFDCASREVMEETGINVLSIKHVDFCNNVFEKEKLHYVTLCVYADMHTGNPKIMEPDKCEEWKWFHYHKFPDNLFAPLENFLTTSKATQAFLSK